MGNSTTYLKEADQKSEDLLSSPKAISIIEDPRSPAVDFTRTPIEVIGKRPQCPRRRNRTMSELTLESLGSSPITTGNYLQGEDETMDSMMQRFHKLRILDGDPRSPTEGIVRTPITVFTESERISLASATAISPVLNVVTTSNSEETLPMETDAVLKDPRSPIAEVVRTPIQLLIWNDENGTPKVSKPPSGKRSKENTEVLAKKLFGTPDLKDSPLQMRTPLCSVGNSPHHILRSKQSRGINAEIGRVSGIENTPPPCLNKYDLATTQLKTHKTTEWGQDSTFII